VTELGGDCVAIGAGDRKRLLDDEGVAAIVGVADSIPPDEVAG
jgi:hypothetical protein